MQIPYKYILATILSFCFTSSYSGDVYKNELTSLKENPTYAGIFDEDISSSLSSIQRDIQLYSHTSFSQRILLFIFFLLDPVVVTPNTMPTLYNYVDGICKSQNMTTPVVFISRKETFFNAFASKLLLSCGGIMIGQKIMVECSDAALEGVIAHELGHIKYNHVNKNLALSILCSIATWYGFRLLLKRDSGLIELFIVKDILTSAIINKRFEKEADEFAYKTIGKGDGLIEFFELLEEKEAHHEQGFLDTYTLTQTHKNDVGFINYLRLMRRYYTDRAFDYVDRAYRWLYHNTFFGAHPSPEARIAAIRAYQQSLEAPVKTPAVL